MHRCALTVILLVSGCDCGTNLKHLEVCDDGRDDDGDGLVDCSDEECFLDRACFATCLDSCTIGLCDVGGARACVKNAQSGCLELTAPIACEGNALCSGGACIPPPCMDQCAFGARSCAGLGVAVRCDTLATTCTDWVIAETCDAGTACSSGVCVPRSECTSVCTPGATRCTADGREETCVGVASCNNWSLPAASAACALPDGGGGDGGRDAGTDGGTDAGGGQPCSDGGSCQPIELQGYESGACALRSDKSVVCWGLDLESTVTPPYFQFYPPRVRSLPPQLTGTLHLAQSAGSGTACVQSNAGPVACWGRQVRPDGRLALVPGLGAGVRSVVNGSTYACAVLLDAGVDCWGAGVRINDGTVPDAVPFPDVVNPARVSGFGAQDEVAAGFEHICARRGSALTCWGYNTNVGACPLGAQPSVRLPGFVTPVTAFDGGVRGLVAHDRGTCAIAQDGRLFCWGDPAGSPYGPTAFRGCPAVEISGFDAPVRQACTGGQHMCAVQENGRVRCWGTNYRQGLLGYANDGGRHDDGTTDPQLISGLGNVAFVACGNAHSCALTQDARVWCWGSNRDGQLGLLDAGLPWSATPIEIRFP